MSRILGIKSWVLRSWPNERTQTRFKLKYSNFSQNLLPWGLLLPSLPELVFSKLNSRNSDLFENYSLQSFPSGLILHKCILPCLFWRLDIWTQGISRTCFPKSSQGSVLCLPPASIVCRQLLVSLCLQNQDSDLCFYIPFVLLCPYLTLCSFSCSSGWTPAHDSIAQPLHAGIVDVYPIPSSILLLEKTLVTEFGVHAMRILPGIP